MPSPEPGAIALERPLAVVTGASSGIGYALAEQFVDHGYDLIVAAEDEGVTAAGERLGSLDGASVEAVRVDLSTTEGVETLYERISSTSRPVAAAALNAGIGMSGRFTETDLGQELELVDLNCRSTVHLAKRLVADMVDRGQGRLLFTSSIASTMPAGYEAVYGASKSFVQSFALALRNELKGTPVTVTSLMPGPVDTPFWERAHGTDTKLGASPSKDDPEDVARQGFEALMAGRERVIASSASSKLLGRMSRLLPDSLKSGLHAAGGEPGSATDPSGPPIGVEAHSVIDYGFAAVSLAGPRLLGLGSRARGVSIGWGLTQGTLNALTDQPYAVRRLVPFKLHGRMESVAVPALAIVVLRDRRLRRGASGVFFGGMLAALGVVYRSTDWDAPTS